MKILIIYTTKTGTTKKCAKKLSETLKSETRLLGLKEASKENINAYDGVILGTYIRVGKVPSKLKKFIAKHPELLKKKLGLFLCMGETREKFDEYLANNFSKDFLQHCSVKGYFGGEFNFKKLNFVIRKVVKKMAEGRELPSVRQENIEKFSKEFESE